MRQQAGGGGAGEHWVVFGTPVQFRVHPTRLCHADGTDGGAQKLSL